MQNPRLASRYAKSILDLAIETGRLEQVYKDMLYLNELISGNQEFATMLHSPVIPSDKKIKVLDLITDGKINVLTKTFYTLLISKNRESNLPEIITAFIKQYKQKKNIHIVKLTTARPVSEEIKNSIISQVQKTSNEMQNIELETVVDESIIGGFVLQTGDKLVDASISYDLKEISRGFENNDFIYKVR